MSSEDTFEDYIDYLDLPSSIMNHFRTSTLAPNFASPKAPKKTMSISVRPLGSPAASPSPSSPPSGRIPFPSHLADYSTPPPEIVPLDPGTLHYVSSSTLRPASSDEPSAKTREVVKMLQRVKALLEQNNRPTMRPTGSTQDVSAMLGRVRGLLASGRSPTLRPGGIRRYPSNPINSQLPVTSQPSPPPTPPPPCCLPASAPRPSFAPTLLLFLIALQWLH